MFGVNLSNSSKNNTHLSLFFAQLFDISIKSLYQSGSATEVVPAEIVSEYDIPFSSIVFLTLPGIKAVLPVNLSGVNVEILYVR